MYGLTYIVYTHTHTHTHTHTREQIEMRTNKDARYIIQYEKNIKLSNSQTSAVTQT